MTSRAAREIGMLRARDPVDARVALDEAARLGLPDEIAREIWARVRAEAARADRPMDAASLLWRLRDAARAWTTPRAPAVGKRTLVGAELRPAAPPPAATVYREAEPGAAIDPDAAALIAAARDAGGRPLPAAARVRLESAFGAALDAIRVHDGDAADAAARALGARAFTVGRDVFFRRGHFQPETREGERLLAHEVAHTQQPGGAPATSLRVSAPGDAAEREADAIADAVVGGARALAAPAAPRATGEVHLDRTPGPREHATRLEVTVEPGDAAAFVLESDGGPAFHATGTASGLVAGEYRVAMRAGRRELAITTADGSPLPQTMRFFISIPPSERGMRTLLRRARAPIPLVITGGAAPATTTGSGTATPPPDTRTQIDQLPAHVRSILFGAVGAPDARPADAAAILRIGQKLADLSDSELDGFSARTTGHTTDLAAFEAGVDRYIAEVHRQRDAEAAVEATRVRLYGTGDVYDQYRQYRSDVAGDARLAALGTPMAAGGATAAQGPRAAQRTALLAALARFGFDSIEAFEHSLDEFLTAFRTNAQLVGLDQLARYDHVLAREADHYRRPGVGASLHRALGDARGHFARASQIRDQQATLMPMTPGEIGGQAEASAQFQAEQAQGRGAIASLSAEHPLLANADIPHEELATAPAAEVAGIMQRYVAARRADVVTTRTNLTSTPDLVFELDTLVETTYVRLGIGEDSMYRRVVRDHAGELAIDHALVGLAVGVLAFAAGLASAGTGTVAVVGGAAALGLGAYQATEEFRRYETMHAAHGAQLLSDDPSIAWVIVALAGVGFDAAGLAATLDAMRPAVVAFNETRDLAQLEQSLRRLPATRATSEASVARAREAVLRAAHAELEENDAWNAALRAGGGLGSLGGGELQRLPLVVYATYMSFRRGALRFEAWLRRAEVIQLFGDARQMTPEATRVLAQTYERAVADLNRIAAHGRSLGWSEDQIRSTLRAWATRGTGTADDVIAEMTAAGRGPAAAPPPLRAAERPAWQVRGWNGPSTHGRWAGEVPGDCDWITNDPLVIRIVGRAANGEANPIPFRQGAVDFSRWSRGRVPITGMRGQGVDDEMELIYEQLANHFNLAPGRSRSARIEAARDYMRHAPDGFGGHGLAPHHVSATEIELVPYALHNRIQHTDMTVWPAAGTAE